MLRSTKLSLRPLCRVVLPISRCSRSPRISQYKPLLQSSRNASVSAPKIPIPRATPKKTLYPEKYIIYHAGTGRTVFLGCLKVTTIFIFSFFTLVVAPAYFRKEDQPRWVPLAISISGLIPLLFVTYVTAPYVTYIHLHLPSYCRSSPNFLLRFSKHLPETATLDITTMNFIGKPRAARVLVKDLYVVKERGGMVNFRRVLRQEGKERKWWMGRRVSVFGVHSGSQTVGMRGEVWANVRELIERNGGKGR